MSHLGGPVSLLGRTQSSLYESLQWVKVGSSILNLKEKIAPGKKEEQGSTWEGQVFQSKVLREARCW